MACANCYLGDMLNNPKFPDVDIIKFEQAISKLPKRCDIRFIGAEPTMNDKLFDLIKIARKYKHKPSLLTNGLKEIEIIQTKLKDIDIRIDSHSGEDLALIFDYQS